MHAFMHLKQLHLRCLLFPFVRGDVDIRVIATTNDPPQKGYESTGPLKECIAKDGVSSPKPGTTSRGRVQALVPAAVHSQALNDSELVVPRKEK
ncbi:hypothetical protein C8Q78DRAFT_317063 [Trametes maxima]|nr:hypothetical protein C8Q78DRAFT_317063 [Trametes maxima]